MDKPALSEEEKEALSEFEAMGETARRLLRSKNVEIPASEFELHMTVGRILGLPMNAAKVQKDVDMFDGFRSRRCDA